MILDEFTKGWLVGDFEPAIIKSKDIEVGIKKYKSGDVEKEHVHNFVDEYTIILSGKVSMNNIIYSCDEIVYIKKGTPTDFKCLEDCVTLVIKTPSIPCDKTLI